VERNKIYSIGFAANFGRFVKCFWQKKWGILIKKESKPLINQGIKIPRDYKFKTEVKKWEKY
ncbi:hypothetical protein B5F13_07430, partial [Drancourtella sp. An177]